MKTEESVVQEVTLINVIIGSLVWKYPQGGGGVTSYLVWSQYCAMQQGMHSRLAGFSFHSRVRLKRTKKIGTF